MLKGTSGVYRSDDMIVVERHRQQFPSLCLSCGGVCAVTEVAPPIPGTRSKLRPPVCPACNSRRGRVAKIIAMAGVAMIIAAPAVYFMLGILPAVVMLLTGVTDLGIAWWLRGHILRFRVLHEDEQYVWIAGAHPDFLAALPSWHGMKLGELQGRGN
ncbi:MAG: hypothetical protein Q8L65_03350 [Burkholderiales bacterium]|nr:hypothetical protein [Burkholderiales bacterium]